MRVPISIRIAQTWNVETIQWVLMNTMPRSALVDATISAR